jgi:predicted chitinase
MTSSLTLSSQNSLKEILDTVIVFAKSCGTGRTSRGVNGGRGGRGAGAGPGGRGPDGEPIRPDIRGTPGNKNITNEEVRKKFVKSLREQGFTDDEIRAALTAAYNESRIGLRQEDSYANTSNERIKTIFGAASSLSDAELTELKKDRTAFFNYMYGPNSQAGQRLGNILEGDGSAYVGRGTIQLTGRGNYERYSRLAGYGDLLVRQPELMVTDPEISTKVTAAYLKDRYRDRGLGTMGNMRAAVAGAGPGKATYDMNIGKDITVFNSIDQSWLE